MEIASHLLRSPKKMLLLTAKRKQPHMQLSFKGDCKCQLLVRRLRNAITRAFPAATLRARLTSRSVISANLKDKLLVFSSSMLTYSFVSSCSASHLIKTTWKLLQIIKGHRQARLKTGTGKCITSAIVAHLVDLGHQVNVKNLKVAGNSSKAVRPLHSTGGESKVIRLLDPSLYTQKPFVQTLHVHLPRFETTNHTNKCR